MKILILKMEGNPRTILIDNGRTYSIPSDSDFYNLKSVERILVNNLDLERIVYQVPVPEVTSIRDFYTFEEHAKKARSERGLEMAKEWYEIPVYYYSGTSMLFPTNSRIPYPDFTTKLDYEMEVAAVIGREGSNIDESDALSHILGLALANDWSARDLQIKEMAVGLGPSKSKDFATSIGPYITTIDEIIENIDEKGRIDLKVECYVNGIKYSSGNLKDMYWSFPKLISWASRNTKLRKGDIIMSGTISTGSIIELGYETYGWLKKGDTVSIRSPILGELNNEVI